MNDYTPKLLSYSTFAFLLSIAFLIAWAITDKTSFGIVGVIWLVGSASSRLTHLVDVLERRDGEASK